MYHLIHFSLFVLLFSLARRALPDLQHLRGSHEHLGAHQGHLHSHKQRGVLSRAGYDVAGGEFMLNNVLVVLMI